MRLWEAGQRGLLTLSASALIPESMGKGCDTPRKRTGGLSLEFGILTPLPSQKVF